MAIADLKSVLKIFGGSDVSAEEQGELYKEVLLMTLARAADADINIQTVEVERIQEILKEHTGQEFSSGDIRDRCPRGALRRSFVAQVPGQCSQTRWPTRIASSTVHALADVFRSDKSVSVLEVDFFNRRRRSAAGIACRSCRIVSRRRSLDCRLRRFRRRIRNAADAPKPARRGRGLRPI